MHKEWWRWLFITCQVDGRLHLCVFWKSLHNTPPPQGRWHCLHLEMSNLGQRNQPPEPGPHGWCMCELVIEDRSSSFCRLPASPLVNWLLGKHHHHELPPSLSRCPDFYAQAVMVACMVVNMETVDMVASVFWIGENLRKEVEWAGVIKPKAEMPVGLFSTALYACRSLVGDRKEPILVVLSENSGVFCPDPWALSSWKLGNHRIPSGECCRVSTWQ